tara:strand:+ start:5055 stop:5387 length:333 start_codon:yes stop_codon:yes gene_type:complete
MTPQNPFNTWENSEEYYGLQDQIADIKMQQQDYKTNFAAGMFGKSNAHMLPEAQKQSDMRLGEFDRKLRSLNQRSEQGKLNFDFQHKRKIVSRRLGPGVNPIKKENTFNF